jgi:ribonuclease R
MKKIKKDTPLVAKDPHYAREAAKYDNPIPSRELILEVLNNAGKPLKLIDIIDALRLSDPAAQEAIGFRLRAMTRDGQVIFNRRRQYVPISQADLIPGRIAGHADGFGFLIPDDKSADDLYLSAQQMRRAMHGDKVLASLIGFDRRGRKEGIIVEVLERSHQQLVGRYFEDSGIGFVEADNKRIGQSIFVPPANRNGAKAGQIVVVAITEYPNMRSKAMGKVVDILGEHMAPGMEIDIALRSHDLPFEWPQAVTNITQKMGKYVSSHAKKSRLDLRSTPLVTIDGEDARDFDDAVYCEHTGKHWRLLVAIADVSHYVAVDRALDKEAIQRGTSVYFPQQVIPMLPEVLSNGLCSLKPKVDRLCMVCEIRIKNDGSVINYEFHEAVMHSAARLTYTDMAAMVVDQDAKLRTKHKKIIKHLDDLYSLYHVLRKQRSQRGAIDFETTETQIEFGTDRKIKSIHPTERNDAHKLIEECMILANVCAAKFLEKHKIPAPHRSHPEPKLEKLSNLREFLAGLGLSLEGGAKPEPSDYARLINSIDERNDAHLIQTVLLRSLSQASYTAEPTGHFGLSLEHYAHFTSPIRRYPDLLVHRAIRHILRKKKVKGFAYSLEKMTSLCEHCSITERRAEDASRDVVAWLKCEYMQDKVGETFKGIITTVTSFGLFVELNDIYIEGLVHVTALANDYYHFDAARHQLVGENSNSRYRVGDAIDILVSRVNLDERKVDFVLPSTKNNSPRPKKKKNSKYKNRRKKTQFKKSKRS